MNFLSLKTFLISPQNGGEPNLFLDFYSLGKVRGAEDKAEGGIQLYSIIERSFQDHLTNICCKRTTMFFPTWRTSSHLTF